MCCNFRKSMKVIPFFKAGFAAALLMGGSMLSGCVTAPVYQRQEGIPNTRWASAYKPSFLFNISDTLSTYNLFFLIRHTEAYPFSNLWLRFSIQGPGDSTAIAQQIEIPLAQDNGAWYGRGMNEIWEQRMPIATQHGTYILFPKKGAYTITFEHLMRTDPLPEVLNVGLRVEKRGIVADANAASGPALPAPKKP